METREEGVVWKRLVQTGLEQGLDGEGTKRRENHRDEEDWGEEREKGGEGERSVRSRVYRDYVDFVSRKKYKNLTIERNILLDYMHKENVCDVVRML